MNVLAAGFREQQREYGFDTGRLEQLRRVSFCTPQQIATVAMLGDNGELLHVALEEADARGASIISTMKDACCCPDCGGWRHLERPKANHPCPPGSWYDNDNPYC